MKRIFLALLLFCLPLAALADGMVLPTIAFPAKVTIPDQRALIHFTNGTERLVIETRFNGAGTNFAWVVPFPSQPVIEEATTGLFPTLEYLFRPEIVHDVPRYYIRILVLLGLIYLLWRASQSVWNAFVAAVFILLLLVLAGLLLPALAAAKTKGMSSATLAESVSVLDRKLVGIFETATIASHDSRALENWLRDNGFAIAPDAKPVIDDYIKDGWVFVAAKVRRDDAKPDTSTPHPLSFTFKTDKPVYPMRLTGLNSQSLSVDLYVFGNARVTAPHFKIESCLRIVHPLLYQWVGGSTVATKLTATLSPDDMRKDVWINGSPFVTEHKNRLFSRHGALTTALNFGAEFFAVGLVIVFILRFFNDTHKTKSARRVGIVTLISIALVGLVYLCLPKIEVKLTRGWPHNEWKMSQFAILIALQDFEWKTTAEVRTGLENLISSPTNALNYGLKNWNNAFLGDRIREEDSPGNYLLRETNNQLQLIFFNDDGGEEVSLVGDLKAQH